MTGSLILASGSPARQGLLERAGVAFRVVVSHVDEAAIKVACQRDRVDPGETAHRLALAKAAKVSADHPDSLVLGADQLLICDDIIYDKPDDLNGVRAHLMALRGRTHHLVNATVIMEEGQLVWRHDDTITMDMRRFSDAFIDAYIEAVGEKACQSVGAYQLEGRGAQLFNRVDGDFFSILGLPLFEVLTYLRGRGIVAS